MSEPLTVIDVVRSGPMLRIRLSGEFGHGEQNSISGRLIQSRLQEAIDQETGDLTEVLLDFSDVTGIGGDGPLWSVGPALQRRLAVVFVASEKTHAYLSELLLTTRMDRLIHLRNG